ncbi:hypothetical protein VPH35_065177 [Triticum aestivum]
MASSVSESFTSRSNDPELIPRGHEEEMAVRLALRRFLEEAHAWQRSDFFRQEFIASAQMTHGSGTRAAVAASPEAMRSVRRSNAVVDMKPLRWRAEAMDALWASSDANMACRARRVWQRGRDATATLAAVDVGEAESHSPVPRTVHQSGRRNRVMVDVANSSQIDLTSTGTQTGFGLRRERIGHEKRRRLESCGQLVSHALFYLAGDRTNTLRGAAGHRTWSRRSRMSGAEPDQAPLKHRCVACNNMNLRYLV